MYSATTGIDRYVMKLYLYICCNQVIALHCKGVVSGLNIYYLDKNKKYIFVKLIIADPFKDLIAYYVFLFNLY